MNILALEASAAPASVCLLCDGAVRARSFLNCGLTHSKTLMREVEFILSAAGLSAAEVDVFAVSNGPGSFTGLRIGAATAKGLAWGAEKLCAGVSTLAAMAALHVYHRGLVVPAMDARRGQVYSAVFRTDGSVAERLCADSALAATELCEILTKWPDEPVLLVGDGATVALAGFSGEAASRSVLAPEHRRYQDALGVALVAAEEKNFLSPGELRLNYLRLSQAEREKAAREKV